MQPNYLKLAKQGDAQAIGILINRSLQPKGINAKIAVKNSCLKVMLESTSVPEKQVLVEFIRRGITNLDISSVKIVQVYGRQTGEDFPAWSQEFTLGEKLAPSLNLSKSNLTDSPTKKQSTESLQNIINPPLVKSTIDQPKVVILSALWSFCKWYISGFGEKPYESIYVSSRFLRVCHTFLRKFLTGIFLFLGFFILVFIGGQYSQYNISSPSNSSISSSPANSSVSSSSSISGKVNGRLCAKNFNDSMAGGAEATFDSSNKTMNIKIFDSGRTLNEEQFQQISTKMVSSIFSTCYVRIVRVDSNSYSKDIQNP